MITVGLYGIPDTTVVSGVPSLTHDHGLTIMKNGRVITTIQLERYSGIKHDSGLSSELSRILTGYVPAGEDLRFVSVNSFLGSSIISSDGNFRIEPRATLKVEEIIQPATCRFFPDGLHEREVSGFIMCHEFAHLASVLPFIGSFQPNTLLVHIDGGASDSSSSVWFFDGKEVHWLDHSWNDLKTVVNNFSVNPLVRAILNQSPQDHLAMPGKLMGYSSYGCASEAIRSWLIENNWFLDFHGGESELIEIVNRHMNLSLQHLDPRHAVCMDIAATIQKEFEDRVIEFIRFWAEQTGAEYLCYSGGAALNILTNTKLERQRLFNQIVIPPCTSDCGLSLGAAAWVEYIDYGAVEIASLFLNRFDLPALAKKRLFDIGEIAEFLQNGNVLGLYQGAGEIGPRALGHRSIIARADDIPLRIRVSETIKKREWYRPVAPIVLEEIAREVFVEDVGESNLPKYMLGAYTVRKECEQFFSGVIHADCTVRAQVITSGDSENRLLFELLSVMRERYGTMGLINTSLNEKGRPIVHYPEDAYRISKEIGLDGVIIDDTFQRFN